MGLTWTLGDAGQHFVKGTVGSVTLDLTVSKQIERVGETMSTEPANGWFRWEVDCDDISDPGPDSLGDSSDCAGNPCTA
jgi:hypothetical protein